MKGFFAGHEAAYAPIPPTRNNLIAGELNRERPSDERCERGNLCEQVNIGTRPPKAPPLSIEPAAAVGVSRTPSEALPKSAAPSSRPEQPKGATAAAKLIGGKHFGGRELRHELIADGFDICPGQRRVKKCQEQKSTMRCPSRRLEHRIHAGGSALIADCLISVGAAP
jgi:hypothetical protein